MTKRNFIRLPEELREPARAMMLWALNNSASTPTQSMTRCAMKLLTDNFAETLADIAPGEAEEDARQAFYSLRIVLHKTDNDIEDFTGWEHDIKGLDAVWAMVETYGPLLHEKRLLTACPTELTVDALKTRSATARVAMSRKHNGIAAIRVPHAVVSLKPFLTIREADGSKTHRYKPAEMWIARLDIGPTMAARALEAVERANGSPLVVKD